MQKKPLLSFYITFLVLACSCNKTKGTESELIYAPSSPKWKDQLYYGTDKDMPVNSHYLMSINYKPGTKVKRIDGLETLAKAFDIYVPHWYLAVMAKNYKEKKSCAVYVNKESYTDYVILWMKDHLINRNNQPHFLTYINDLGFQDVTQKYAFPGYESPAYTGVCVLIATGDHKLAEEEMINELKEWRAYYNRQ